MSDERARGRRGLRDRRGLKVPGVYVEEESFRARAIEGVPTDVTAFVGYTETASDGGDDVTGRPIELRSPADFTGLFGGPPAGSAEPPSFHLARSVERYFAHGGRRCWVVSVGSYSDDPTGEALRGGIDALEEEPEPSLLVVPDAVRLPHEACSEVQRHALRHCAAHRNRLTILDVREGHRARGVGGSDCVLDFRSGIGTEHLRYGAAYYPWLRVAAPTGVGRGGRGTPSVLLPPSGAVAGVYARTDASRGVWKAPANEALLGVEPTVDVPDGDQEELNGPPDGKAVNAIRSFPGRGTLVWGARTLAGNDAEWRYVNVRRSVGMIEASIKRATEWAVFEPNDADLWRSLRSSVGNFLRTLWREGALQGATPEQAFFVHVGVGETMTQLDVLEGRLVVEIGVALVRPAEFVILRIAHKTAL